MSKAVMISIRPQWVEKIAKGEKTIEVRRTVPKLQMPFKCYIYETKGKGLFVNHGRSREQIGGKVIGEFVCDRIEKIEPGFEYYSDGYDLDDDILTETCLTREELMDYGKGVILYGWHISDLKIYDKPKELGEFRKPCSAERCYDCRYWDYFLDKSDGCCIADLYTFLKRPFQSWGYVEEL